MRLSDERVFFSVLLILFSIFLGQILGEALDSFLPHIPAWVQPPDGDRVIDMRVSESYRLDQCAILAQMDDREIYLYAPPDSHEKSMVVNNVTDVLPDSDLPQAFAVKSLAPLQLDVSDTPQNKWTIDSMQYLGVPAGEVVKRGRCFRWIELFTEDLNAVLVNGRGLWVAWRSGDSLSGSNERRMTLPILGVAVTMTVSAAVIYRFMWRK